ncbi:MULTISPECIES: SGNH/GDSL hydrolase family protein [Streptomyces]|uniref:SGNH/GDSL hydrolase family protein n=1 Tax=Streptomyces TaxID=1883 RepID=UPI001F175643|nr:MULTISPECIES: SGNH/GDSL hydrolase family protein [Streptomyces]
MAKRNGYALLAALAAVVVLVSTAIFVSAGGRASGGSDDSSRRPGEQQGGAAPAVTGNWVGTWAASAAAPEPNTLNGWTGMSIRNVVHTSIGGTAARVRLSNLFGTRPLVISHATIALASAPSSPTAEPGTMHRLTFSGRTTVRIPAGRHVVSDAARLTVPPTADLLVTTYSPSPSGPATYHPTARQTSYVAKGDRAGDMAGTAYTGQSPYWRYVTAVDVRNSEAQGAVVTLGDSITDGVTSTTGANRRWPDFLAQRLRDEQGAPYYGVLNEGISGNRILVDGSGPSGLSRIDRDVLSHSGVRAVVIQLGVNDILRLPHQLDADRIVEGLRQLTQKAHGRGLKVVGGTLMPFGGHRGFSERTEATRQQVNAQIRAGGVFDAVVDFDEALRDPSAPHRLLPEYDSGDHLHPSDEGYRAMAHALDLDMLKGSAPAKL